MFEQCCSVSKRFEKLGQLLSLFPPPLRPWPFFFGAPQFSASPPREAQLQDHRSRRGSLPHGVGAFRDAGNQSQLQTRFRPPAANGRGGGPRDHPRRSYPRGIYLCGEPSPVPTEVRLELSGSKGQRAHGSKGAAPRPWVDLSDPWLLHA